MVKAVVAGTGPMAALHGLVCVQNGVELVGVAGPSAVNAGVLAERFSVAAVSHDDLPAGADLVVVANDTGGHAELAQRALEAGAAVLCEPPLCTTLADADKLVDTAVASSHRFAYGEALGYAPVSRALFERLPSLGALHHLELRFQQRHQRQEREPSAGGDDPSSGVLFELGSRAIALAMLTALPSTVASVRAELSTDTPTRTGLDDHAEAELVFSSGLHARIVASRRPTSGARSDATQWSWQAASRTAVLRAEFHPQPELELNGTTVGLPAPRFDPPQPEQLGLRDQLLAFVHDLSLRRQPWLDVGFGRAVLDVVYAAYASAGSGNRFVPVPFEGSRRKKAAELWHS